MKQPDPTRHPQTAAKRRQCTSTAIVWAFMVLIIIVMSCAVSDPVTVEYPGAVETRTTKRFIGIPYAIERERVEAPATTTARLKREKAERKQDIDLKRSERQEYSAWIFGVVMFILATACVVYAAMSEGWKYFGLMAAVFFCIGAFAWGFAHWLPYLRWACIPVVILVIARVLHCARLFSLVGWVKQKREPKPLDTGE